MHIDEGFTMNVALSDLEWTGKTLAQNTGGGLTVAVEYPSEKGMVAGQSATLLGQSGPETFEPSLSFLH